jgi:hypothetical protein
MREREKIDEKERVKEEGGNRLKEVRENGEKRKEELSQEE